MIPLRIATYNIHGCVGTDREYLPTRISDVIRELNADIIGLQEVDTSVMSERGHQLAEIVHLTGLHAVEGFILERRAGHYGNVLLSRFPVQAVRRIDLSIRGAGERRGALDVDLLIQDELVRVVVAHLGLNMFERHFQVGRLMRALGDNRSCHIIMMGDFNLWSSILPQLRRLHRRLGHVPLVTTYPSTFPLFPLDRIWVQPMSAMKAIAAHATPLSKLASDHLPLVASIELPATCPPEPLPFPVTHPTSAHV